MKTCFGRKYSLSIVCLALLLALSFCSVALGQNADTLAGKIDGYLADKALVHGIQGVLIKSLKDGRVLYDHNSDLVFIPASNFKLIVSTASLDLLGPDFRMQTSLFMGGSITETGTLVGDLVLVGGGDPVFSRKQLEEMVPRIKAMGIKMVQGNIVGDDTRFDEQRLGDGWESAYEPYYYSAQISGLNVDENVVGVTIRPGAMEGAPVVVEVTPASRYMIVRNTATTAKAGSTKTVSVDRVRAQNIIRVTGTVPLDYKPAGPEEAITMEEPTVYACTLFKDILAQNGIKVRGRAVRGTKPKDAQVIATHDSPPMSEMIALLHKPSDNLVAECMLKNLGAQKGKDGSSSSGADVEKEWLQKIGGDPTAVSINDGSGLCRADYISPANLVAILIYMHRHKDGKYYYDSLPIAGVDGTIRNRMKGTAAEKNVHAKTGYIGRVRSLSGYVTTKSGEELVFSIMMNAHMCPSSAADAVQDKIVVELANLGG